jgi:Tol biopolymer transport system component
VWKVATDGSAPARQITFGDKGESQAQFSPDGKYISFVSARGAAGCKAQIYLMPIDGGESFKLTDAKESVSSYSWAPDRLEDSRLSPTIPAAPTKKQHQEARRRARLRR